MLKYLAFFFALILVIGCRKDTDQQLEDFVSDCGNYSEPYCLHPIPANDSIVIHLYVSVNDRVVLTYFDRWGNNIEQKLDSNLLAGKHIFKFDVLNLPIGVNLSLIHISEPTRPY